MTEPTDADRKTARAFVADLLDAPTPEYRDDVERDLAAALAAERERARAVFLALADVLDGEAQARWVYTLRAREAGTRDAEFGERGAGDALHDAAVRIRGVAEDGP